MKKILSLVMTTIIAMSFIACGAKQEAAKTETKLATINSSDSSFKAKEVVTFTDITDNLGNKDYFYNDTSVVKIVDKNVFKAYQGKSLEITKKAMEDKKVDVKNMKVYTYYKNVNGERMQKDYVVVYDDKKVATDIYEVSMTISDKDEPTFKEAKKLDKVVDDKFKELFNKELAPAK